MASESLDKEQAKKAVHALFQCVQKQGKSDEGFLGEGDDISIQMTFKKVPENKILRIPLPTTLLREASDVCLFVKDLDKNKREYSDTVDHYKELLEKKGIKNVNEIMPLKMLNLEYQPYEAKRNLSNMYDCYLSDDRVCGLLPNLLGKHFYARKRIPMSVDLLKPDLKREIDSALTSTQLIIKGRGATSQVTLGHTAMTEEQVVENIMAVCERIKDKLADGFQNISRLFIRTQSSPSIPIYHSQGSANDITINLRKRKADDSVPEEISTLMDRKVRVTAEGHLHFYTMDDEPVIKQREEKPKRKTKKITDKKSKATGPPIKKPKNQVKQPVKSKKAPKNKKGSATSSVKSTDSAPVKTKKTTAAKKTVSVKKITTTEAKVKSNVKTLKSKNKNGLTKSKPQVKKLKAK